MKKIFLIIGLLIWSNIYLNASSNLNDAQDNLNVPNAKVNLKNMDLKNKQKAELSGEQENVEAGEPVFTPAQEDSIRKLLLFYNRFRDTTFIYLNDLDVKSEKTYLQGFDNAVEEFDAGNYNEALTKFNLYAETLPQNDSLYFEIEFFIAECYVAKNDLNNAKYILENIELNPQATNAVMEKVLVRLGQIWCVLDDFNRAEQYFELLKDKYPYSIYIALADCGILR